jgi:hypothetical protein
MMTAAEPRITEVFSMFSMSMLTSILPRRQVLKRTACQELSTMTSRKPIQAYIAKSVHLIVASFSKWERHQPDYKAAEDDVPGDDFS